MGQVAFDGGPIHCEGGLCIVEKYPRIICRQQPSPPHVHTNLGKQTTTGIKWSCRRVCLNDWHRSGRRAYTAHVRTTVHNDLTVTTEPPSVLLRLPHANVWVLKQKGWFNDNDNFACGRGRRELFRFKVLQTQIYIKSHPSKCFAALCQCRSTCVRVRLSHFQQQQHPFTWGKISASRRRLRFVVVVCSGFAFRVFSFTPLLFVYSYFCFFTHSRNTFYF